MFSRPFRSTVSLSNPVIKELTVQDLPAYAQLGPLFYKEGGLPGEFKQGVFVTKWTTLIENGLGFILGLEENGEALGALGAVVFPDINNDDLTVSEAFWFVHPDKRGAGVRLLQAFEDKARKLSAKKLIMCHLLALHPEKLSELYQRRGFTPVEVHYLKTLT